MAAVQRACKGEARLVGTVAPVSKPAPANRTGYGFENARFAKFRCIALSVQTEAKATEKAGCVALPSSIHAHSAMIFSRAVFVVGPSKVGWKGWCLTRDFRSGGLEATKGVDHLTGS